MGVNPGGGSRLFSYLGTFGSWGSVAVSAILTLNASRKLSAHTTPTTRHDTLRRVHNFTGMPIGP